MSHALDPQRPSCPGCGVPMVSNGTRSTGGREWWCRQCAAVVHRGAVDMGHRREAAHPEPSPPKLGAW